MSTNLPANVPGSPTATGGAVSNDVRASMPAHLQNDTSGDLGVELLSQFIVPPRIKIVQPQSSPELKKNFREGDVIVQPNNSILAEVITNAQHIPQDDGNPFYFTPIFFYPEWVAWNPLTMRGSMPAIHERSLDPKSQLAMKCKARMEEAIGTVDGKPAMRRFVEHLNYVVMPYNHELFTEFTPAILSFARGEHKTGMKFNGEVKLRRAKIWGTIFEARANRRVNDKGNWFGFNITNPIGFPAWVEDTTLYNALADARQNFIEIYNAGRVLTDYGDDDLGATTVDAVAPGAGKNEY